MVQGIDNNVGKCGAIIKLLKKLEKDIKKANDELNKEVDTLMEILKQRKKKLHHDLQQLEAKMKSLGCVNNSGELLRAIFTLGIACLFDSPTKKKMMNVRADIQEEKAIMEALAKRLFYFDDLKDSGKKLLHTAGETIKTVRHFESALKTMSTALKQDFNDKEIDENLGDIDFANIFAESLEE